MIATITIGIDPTFELGPLTLAWHGLMTATGVLVGAVFAGRVVRRWGLPSEPTVTIALLAAVGGLVGGRVLYVLERGLLDSPGEWLSTRGFSFNGGFVLAAIAIAVHIRRARLPLRYLDAVAVALPLALAVGRIGDVVNGEHYGPATSSPLGVRNTHPDASVPSPDVAYHSGGLYEVILGLAVFAVVWPLRDRIRTPTLLTWMVVGLIGLGRFVEFFWRSDSDTVALGLSSAQGTSLAILAVALVGGGVTWRYRRCLRASAGHSSSSSTPSPSAIRFT